MKISIIMSVYNTELYLKQAIDSVVQQTFSDWELIIVDDGSTDKSVDIIDEYVASDNRIIAIHKNNTGQADSRNLAIKKAKGEYIAFIDSDDWYEPNYLEFLVQTIESRDVDIAICGYFLDYKTNKKEIIYDLDSVIDANTAFVEIVEDNRIKSFLWDKLFKRQLLTELMPVIPFYEDYLTVFKWFRQAKKVGYLPIPLYNYRQRKSSTDHNKSALKNYHFFKAELNRFEYMKANNCSATMYLKLQSILVKCAIRELKHMARNCSMTDGMDKYRNAIIEDIKPYLTNVALTNNDRFRLYLIMHAPKLFYIIMKLSGVFVIKKESNNNLYD